MDTIGANLQAVKQRIANAARAFGRDPATVGLIAVSKTFDADAVAAAYRHGQLAFGENYVQEALDKMATLASISNMESRVAPAHRENNRITSDARGHSAGVASPEGSLLRPPEWHFIGPIQGNKTRAIADHFSWVHSIDREKIAHRLSAARPPALAPLQVCLQVNIGGERSKGGVVPGPALLELARAVAALPRLKLRGLMAIPPPNEDPAQQRRHFAELRRARDALAAAGIALDTLSMGMSADLEAAIAEGATLVRVGTAIFGQRQ